MASGSDSFKELFYISVRSESSACIGNRSPHSYQTCRILRRVPRYVDSCVTRNIVLIRGIGRSPVSAT